MASTDAGSDERGSWRRWESGVIGAPPAADPEEDPEGLVEVNFLAPENQEKLATMLRWAAEGRSYEEVREEAESWLPELLSPRRDQGEPPEPEGESQRGADR